MLAALAIDVSVGDAPQFIHDPEALIRREPLYRHHSTL